MGCYDSVFHKCPCGQVVEWQSKAGVCQLEVYWPDSIPLEIAINLNREVEVCPKCKKIYRLVMATEIQNVAMIVKEVSC